MNRQKGNVMPNLIISRGTETGICPVCNELHKVRKEEICGGYIFVMDEHRVSGSDSPRCRGIGEARQ